MALSNNALTTLAEVKTYLGIDTLDTSQDSFLERKINSISDFIEKATNRRFRKDTYTEKLSGSGTTKINLKHYPIISVASVTIDDEEITDYEVISDYGQLFYNKPWRKTGLGVGMAETLAHLKRNITVEYTAGYVLPKDNTTENPRTLPYDLEDVVIQMISNMYNQKSQGGDGLESFKISDIQWVWDKTMPDYQKSVIMAYKAVRI